MTATVLLQVTVQHTRSSFCNLTHGNARSAADQKTHWGIDEALYGDG